MALAMAALVERTWDCRGLGVSGGSRDSPGHRWGPLTMMTHVPPFRHTSLAPL